MLAGFTRRFSPLNLLTEEEMEAVHRGALYILESTGALYDLSESALA
jgi:trimethylamine:corrinoid methyltransferase-like protein